MDLRLHGPFELTDSVGVDETFRPQHRHPVHFVDLDRKVSHA
jgi:hypothetical protein